jgi:hypothetical protein
MTALLLAKQVMLPVMLNSVDRVSSSSCPVLFRQQPTTSVDHVVALRILSSLLA